jgi:hypothetical protein
MDPILITYDNAPNENSKFFFETCIRNGWKINHIGNGETWLGFINKINAYKKVCEELPADQIVVLSDSRDVFCTRAPIGFIDGFNEFKSDIVVSTEIFSDGYIDKPDTAENIKSMPLHAYYKHHNITPGIRKYINSGLIAGRANALAFMWSWIIEQKFEDDQLGVHSFANTFPDKVALDKDAVLLHSSTFAVHAGVKNMHIQKLDAPTFGELLGCSAFFLHIPGTNLRGQGKLYEIIKDHLQKYSSFELLKLYGYRIPQWNEIF